jgi:hypothetical protein
LAHVRLLVSFGRNFDSFFDVLPLPVFARNKLIHDSCSNTWPKDPHLKRLGFWFRQDLSELVQTLTPSVMKLSGMTPKDIPDFQEEVKRCVLDRKIHAYHIM